MTKADIIDALYEKVGITRQDSTRLTALVLEIMKEALEKGEKVKISSFGNFVVRKKRARRGRNPKTGDEITITPRTVLTFKASPVLKQALNKK